MTEQERLTIVPTSLKEANAFVELHHRHHKATRGHKWSIGVEAAGVLVGVATIGRSVARMLHSRHRCEVTRVCTDGTPNACSALYGAACRSKKEMGYHVAHTYILASEDGTSLRAAGWRPVAISDGGSWNRPSRGRTDKAPTVPKVRWECRHSTAPEIKLLCACRDQLYTGVVVDGHAPWCKGSARPVSHGPSSWSSSASGKAGSSL